MICPAIRRPLALCIATVLACTLVSDLAVRALFPIPQLGYAVWSLPPGSKVLLSLGPDGFEAPHRYNRFGFRGADFPIESDATVRIACIGDSYTEGLGAAEDETWPAELDRQLSDLDCEVLNLGCAGADARVYGRILCEAAAPLRPTDVVVCFLADDLKRGPRLPYGLRESWRRKPATCFRDPFREDRAWPARIFAHLLPGWTYLVDRVQGRWPRQTGQYWPRWSKRYLVMAVDTLREEQGLERARAHNLVNQRIHDIDPKVLSASLEGKYHPLIITCALVDPGFVRRVRVTNMGVPVEALRTLTHRWVEWLEAKCAEAGIRAWLLFFPDDGLVAPAPLGPLKEEATSAADVIGDTSARDLFAEACQGRRVRFIDAMDVLMRHRHEKLYHRYDTHPTARAYELVAGVVADALRTAVADR